MKKKTYRPEPIVKMLREVEAGQAAGKTVEELCRGLGIAESSYHRWKNQYGTSYVDEVRRLRELETENERLKWIVAELTLDNKILKAATKGNGPARPVVARWWPTPAGRRVCPSGERAGRWG